jgi:peptidyl-prolyl cis-trans isomerase C
MGQRREEGRKNEGREKMRRVLFHLCLPLILLLFPGCGLWEGGLPEHIIARIDREEITIDEFNREFKELVTDQNREGSRSELREVKEAYLNQMIERKILAQEARRLGIRVSAEELSQAILEIKRDYPGEGFGEKLGLTGMSLEKWKVRLEEKLLAEKMVRSGHPYQGKIEEKSAREFYETHRSLFQLPRRVRVRQIVVTDGNEAIQIQKRLKKGESFEKLAKEKSLGPEKVQGGDLGYFSEGERPAEFDHVFSMEVGAISEVIKSPYGYHLFKLEEKSEPREISFEEAKKGILQRLEREKGEEEYQRWFKDLREKAKVKVNRKWLRS